MPDPKTAEKIIIALDVETPPEARAIVSDLQGTGVIFKVGLQLFTAAGPAFVRELTDAGERIFLDLKFHDIPNTVAMAAVEAARSGVWMFNVHSLGGGEMMRRTVNEVGGFCERERINRPKIIAVTILTSSTAETLAETGIETDIEKQVVKLARLAESSGLDGVVASPLEIKAIRENAKSGDFLIVTPGIRPVFATNDDQKRVMTPRAALSAGADHLVIGRPVTKAADRRKALEDILREIETGS